MQREGRLGVGIVGAGRVGPVIGAALAGVGHQITGITSGADDDRAAAILPGVPLLSTPEVLRRSELVVLAVPREELPGLVAGLAHAGHWQMGQLVLHTDAAFGIEVLRPAAERGAIPLAVHPAMAFTGTSIDLRQLAATYAAVSAPAPVLPIAQALAVELGCEPIVVAEEDRAAYAEAIETASAFSRQIVHQATGILRGIGVENPGGFLSSLVRSTVDQALAEASPAIPDLPPDDGA
ncbi:Rossmann-like and DUF2520 domain-containing protein [Microbacterium excoecariae]|uniref:Rossmann-like and DUF2520 domain-containing protein n=1 Tax=Microbacterium excoecariae TaxID=2715210 RepID=UPI0014094378|nr:DUF2520 domain-containing protein [Microbacterium excoecariae]NHI16228.1 DUF2520 domain-containing protein [Microbacterium excoecariae]